MKTIVCKVLNWLYWTISTLLESFAIGRPRVLIGNFNDFLGENLSKEDEKKCRRLSPRLIFLTRRRRWWGRRYRDVLALSQMMSDEFLDYVRGVYGEDMPEILVPDHCDCNFSLVRAIREDGHFTERLRALGPAYWLDALIMTKHVHRLAEDLGMKAAGPSRTRVENGLVERINNKERFQDLAAHCRIRTTGATICFGAKEIRRAARLIFEQGSDVMLRLAYKAGGLGNMDFVGRDDLEAFLTNPHTPVMWTAERVLVEPVLPVVHAASTTFRAGPFGVRFVCDSDRFVFGNRESAGTITPARMDVAVRAEMIRLGARFARLAWSLGYRGWLDVDWGVLQDGSLVAFECNARWLATCTGVEASRSMGGRVFITRDCIRTGREVTLQHALAWLEDNGLHWDPLRRDGIFITIPPAGGSMAVVIMAQDLGRAETLNAILAAWAERTCEEDHNEEATHAGVMAAG